jgi:hypothetical protein
MSIHYFSCWGGTGVDSKTSVMGHVTLNSCFPSGGIWGSRMHPYASGAQYGDALSFMLGWAGVVSIKKRARTNYVELVFASGGIYGSCNAFWCVQGTKHRCVGTKHQCTIFMLRWLQ